MVADVGVMEHWLVVSPWISIIQPLKKRHFQNVQLLKKKNEIKSAFEKMTLHYPTCIMPNTKHLEHPSLLSSHFHYVQGPHSSVQPIAVLYRWQLIIWSNRFATTERRKNHQITEQCKKKTVHIIWWQSKLNQDER